MQRYRIFLLAIATAVGVGACDEDGEDEETNRYVATLTGQAERPTPVTTTATGNFELTDNGTSMTYTLTVNGVPGPITGAHIHAVPRSGVAPADTTGGVFVNLNPSTTVTSGVLAQGTFTTTVPGISLDSLRTLMNAGRTYVNVHTQANPGGHLRGTITRR